MEKIIKIGDVGIEVKVFKGKRVVTFKDIDRVHRRPDGTARKRFNDNQERFIAEDDYYFVKPKEVEMSEIRTSEINNAGTYLITESGYLMLVKSFTDDLAWEVQRKLVNFYFRGNEQKPKSAIQIIQEAILEVNQKISDVNTDLQEFKRDLPLLGVECDEIKKAKNKKVVPLLGGKNAAAYKNKSLRSRVYIDINNQLCREFGVSVYAAIKRCQTETAKKIIEEYKLPLTLEEEIRNTNSQLEMNL